ncbi:MAG: ATP-binding cassette domain-containing protein [Dehalococcoidales bacterium]|nr:ATP-binding cassette domain-containing protein [Dehalococcoidales bacterium]
MEKEHNLFDFISVRYRDVIDIPNLSVGRGITTLFGPSGGGKTTILKMLNRMVSPTEGKIVYNSTPLVETNPVEHRRRVVMLSQNPVMFEGSIHDNLNAPFKFQKRPFPHESAIYQVLESVGLDKNLKTTVNVLSGGEKQRLALARIILLQPEVFLLDEPSSALDADSADIVIETICHKARIEKKSIIMVTHSKTIARKYSDIIIRVAQGKITGQELNDERGS